MGIVVRLKITGLREMLRAFRALPKDATREMREASIDISETLAGKIRTAAASSPRQGSAVAPSVRAVRAAVPMVQAGGRKRAGSQSRRSSGQSPTTASDLVYGANFGAAVLKQFPAVAQDHFFFKTIDRNMGVVEREWIDAAERTLAKWGSG
jgi:hypothetical protein